jgi:hypothetical protein
MYGWNIARSNSDMSLAMAGPRAEPHTDQFRRPSLVKQTVQTISGSPPLSTVFISHNYLISLPLHSFAPHGQ